VKGDPVRGFGGLEAQVMDWLWRAAQPMTVREVLDRLNADRARPLAYTSVLTVLDNLFRKDAVCRDMVGRAWCYAAARSRQSYAAELMREALATSGDRSGTLTAFLQQLSPAEAAQLSTALETAPRSPK
jgi:predicted transcriptional regulator